MLKKIMQQKLKLNFDSYARKLPLSIMSSVDIIKLFHLLRFLNKLTQ